MLSPAALNLGQEAYYSELARGDYYEEGGEPPGYWLGPGAARLGLEGAVQREQLSVLFRGYSPVDGEELVQHQAGREHQPGWDLTFSAPKSVSVLWGVLPDRKDRDAIAQAHAAAVADAIGYLQAEAAYSRRGKGGKTLEPCELVVAAYEHGTSRLADPQLHTHALAFNAAYRVSDDSWGTIVSSAFYGDHRFAAGSIYRMSLARRLQEIGYETIPRSEGKLHSFELSCVPRHVRDQFSKRRAEMEEALESWNVDRTGKNFALAALYTRSTKGHVARSELQAKWRTEALESGLDLEGIERTPKVVGESEQERLATQAIEGALSKMAQRGRSFSRPYLVSTAAARMQSSGVEPRVFMKELDRILPESVIELENSWGTMRAYAAPSVSQAQERVKDTARAMLKDNPSPVNFNIDEALLGTYPQSIQCVETYPGADVAGFAKELAQAWKENDLRVRGVCRTRGSASRLERTIDVKSDSIGKLLEQLNPALRKEQVAHDGGVMPPTKASSKRRAAGSLKLTRDDIITVHDAHRMHPAPLGDLLERAKSAGAKVVLFGERKGWGLFDQIADGTPTVVAPGKPIPIWRIHAREILRSGDRRGVLEEFQKNRCLHPLHSGDRVRVAMAHNYVGNPKSVLVGANKAEVDRLNKAVQYERGLKGLGRRVKGVQFKKGERIVFDRSHGGRGVSAGEFAVVEGFATVRTTGPFTREVVKLKLEEKGSLGWSRVPFTRRITMPVKDLAHTSLAYAFTPEAAQELDSEYTYVHLTPDLELSRLEGCTSPQLHLIASYSALGEDLEATYEAARENELTPAVAPEQPLEQSREAQPAQPAPSIQPEM